MHQTSRREVLKVLGTAAAALAAGGAAAGGAEQGAAAKDSAGDGPIVTEQAVRHDLHTHTLYSDGAHPIPLHILEARAFELDALAITDHHFPGFKIHDSEEEFNKYLAEIEKERSGQDDCLIIKGVETTALDTSGKITLDERRAERLEWILCDLGGKSEGTLRGTPPDKSRYVDNVLATYLGMCDVPYLNVIAHPFNTGNTTPAALPEDYPEPRLRELAAKMADKGKVFDVMNDTIFWFSKSGIAPRALTAQYVALVKIFAAQKVRFQVSSDDHRTGVGNTRWSQIVLARAGVPRSQIVDPKSIRRVDGR
ncbi:MAG: PHP domain-containing protein [Planctomycetota bacterium]|nr:PHP domain-containing protein [Planctomycetota bacterium]